MASTNDWIRSKKYTPWCMRTDNYKLSHRVQFPPNTSLVFSALTPRSNKYLPYIDEVTWVGLQYYIINKMMEDAAENFFDRELDGDECPIALLAASVNDGTRVFTQDDEDAWRELHAYGRLPVTIRALPEGTQVPIGVPPMVIWNTDPRFFWVTNFLETTLSQSLWSMITSASIARHYRSMFAEAFKVTGGRYVDLGDFTLDRVDILGHDFSARGMSSAESSDVSGAGHLFSFQGTDTVSAVPFLRRYYDAPATGVAGSVAATEHAVMCAGGNLEGQEEETFRRLIQDLYPDAIISIVSDTWDYWNVLTKTLPTLKPIIEKREHAVVIRPDSGDPVKILCGDPDAPEGSPENLGTFELLWETFGGSYVDNNETDAQAYRLLHPSIGVIYGDSITPERAQQIINRLIEKGFVPNMVFGIGSYTYQYNTRDSFGFAIKATAAVVDGELREIFKDPKTDDGTKKSACGLQAVLRNEDGELYLKDRADWDEVMNCEFITMVEDGRFVMENFQRYEDIRDRVRMDL